MSINCVPGITSGNNYLFNRSIPTFSEADTEKKSPFDKPLELKPVDNVTDNEFVHGEPLLKTVQLETNEQRGVSFDTVFSKTLRDSTEAVVHRLPSAEQNEKPTHESAPAVSAPQTLVVEEVTIKPASLVVHVEGGKSHMDISTETKTEFSSVVIENETMSSKSENKTQLWEVSSETKILEGNVERQTLDHEYRLPETVTTLDTERETQIPETRNEPQILKNESAEINNDTETSGEIVSTSHNELNKISFEEVSKQLSPKEDGSEIIPESCSENDVKSVVEIYSETKSNDVSEEKSCVDPLEKANEDVTAEGEEGLLESFNIERIIREKEEAQWQDNKSDDVEADILSAWDAVDSDSEELLAQVNLSVIDEPSVVEPDGKMKINEESDSEVEHLELEEKCPDDVQDELEHIASVHLTKPAVVNSEKDVPLGRLTEQMSNDGSESIDRMAEQTDGSPQTSEMEVAVMTVDSNSESMFIDEVNHKAFLKTDEETSGNIQDPSQADILEARLNEIDSNAEKLLTESATQRVSSLISLLCIYRFVI